MSVLEYTYDEPTAMWRIVESMLPAGQYSFKMCPTHLEYNGKVFSIADAVARLK